MDNSTLIGPVGYASLSDVKEKRCKKEHKNYTYRIYRFENSQQCSIFIRSRCREGTKAKKK